MIQSSAESVVEVACALVRDGGGRFLACRRASHVRDAGAWEFPGGKIEAGEAPADCVRRELLEELSVDASAQAPEMCVEATVSGRRLRLYACPTTLAASPVKSTDHDRITYLSLDEFLRVPVTEAERILLERLRLALTGFEP